MSQEKQKLFYLVGSYLSSTKKISETIELNRLLHIAKVSNSHESYHCLVEYLHSSFLVIPGFHIERSRTTYGYALKVKFSDSTFFVPDKIESSLGLHRLSTSDEQNWYNYTDDNIQDTNDPIRANGSKTCSLNREVTCLRQSLSQHKNQIHDQGNEIERLREQVFFVLDSKARDRKDDEIRKKEELDTVKDACSFIMVDPWSLAAFTAWFIFIIQLASFYLSVSDNLDYGESGDFQNTAPFGFPAGVNTTVHFSQGVALLLIVIAQDSMWEAIADLFNGYNTHLENQHVTYVRWIIPNLMRLVGGFVALFVTLILAMASDNPVDLFKDFTAMLFISRLDNIVYFLASVDVLGSKMFETVQKIEKITFKSTYQMSITGSLTKNTKKSNLDWIRYVLHQPQFFALVVTLLVYLGWFLLVLKPHKNGKYLCQKVYMQLDGGVNSNLPYFSGYYAIQSNRWTFNTDIRYKESRLGRNQEMAAIVRHCREENAWVLTEEDRGNSENECSEKSIFAKSTNLADEQMFNLFEVSKDDWTVKNDGRWMPFDNLYISCQDKKESYNFTNVCSNIQVDDRYQPFATTRLWPTHFSIFHGNEVQNVDKSKDSMIQMYERPVYRNENDLIFFTGKRWVITEMTSFQDINEGQELEEYLQTDFHGRWSEYTIAFFSEPVITDTLQDTKTPIGLIWYESSPKIDGILQIPNENEEVRSIFLCSICNDDSNPCFYGGRCLSNHTCDCTSGSSGSLCQVLPTGNGLCNTYFDYRKYNYDGGDCCINTCVSSDEFKCGRDKSGLYYVGYDLCKTETFLSKGFRKSISSSFDGLFATFVRLSENGHSLALIDSLTSSVFVFDNDGSNWIKRGSAVTSLSEARTSVVQISAFDSGLTYQNTPPPITVVIKTTTDVAIYIWDKSYWKEQKRWLFDSTTIKEVQLHNRGNILGVLLQNRTFNSYERAHYFAPWNERNENISYKEKQYDFFSFPIYEASHFILANRSCIELHSFENNDNQTAVCSEGKEIRAIKMSRNGESVAMLVDNQGTIGNILRYSLRNGGLETMEGLLRGISIINPSIEIADSGLILSTHSSMDKSVLIYSLINNTWYDERVQMGENMSFSAERSTLAVISSTQESTLESNGLVSIYHIDLPCGEGMSRFYFTFIADNNPLELSWEMVNISSSGFMDVLLGGGTLVNEEGMVVEEVCLGRDMIANENSTDYCIAIKITDLGLDGLRSPGKVGISVNGTVKWSIDSTDGYETIIPVFGNIENCMSQSNSNARSPKYNDVSLHHDCSLEECSWIKIGSEDINYTIAESESLSPSFDLSADGSVFALAYLRHQGLEGRGLVRILEYQEGGGWVQRGSNITGPNQDDWFGYSVSMSADGSIVAVGDPRASIDEHSPGYVYVYSYDNVNSIWVKSGDEIDGGYGVFFGHAISLSADGTVIAVGTGLEIRSCHIHVYKYDKQTKQWKPRGTCLDGTEDSGIATVDLSSTGYIVAIGYKNRQKNRGEAKVYVFEDSLNDWILRGHTLEGNRTGHCLGKTISLSSNGLFLAVAGAIHFPIKVFSFNIITGEWEQRGQDITLHEGNDLNVALSSSGSVLVITYNYVVKYYLYDELLNIWQEGLEQVPSTSYSGNLSVKSQIALSADALIVAAKADAVVDIYQFITEDNHHHHDSICTHQTSRFNFTIKPDHFPQDIAWSLRSKNDATILGGRLSQNYMNLHSFDRFAYSRCVQSNNTYFTFLIEDTNGDGLCCNWGQGYFSLKWNHQEVLDSDGFQDLKFACLPLDTDVSLFSVEIRNSSAVATWALFDSENGEKLFRGKQTPDSRKTYSYNKCLQLPKCAYFAIFYGSGNTRGFSLKYNNSIVYDQKDEEFTFQKVPIGACDVPPCPSGYTFLEVDIGIGDDPRGSSWELVHPNSTVFDKSESFTGSYKLYHYQKCVLDQYIDCLSLVLIDRTNNGGENYIVSKNASRILENETNDFFEKVAIGHCNNQLCSEGEHSLDVEFVFEPIPRSREKISWELTDSNNTKIVSRDDNHYMKGQNYYHHHKCVSAQLNECFTFRLFDVVGQGEVYYLLTWNGYTVRMSPTIANDFVTKVTIGEGCTDTVITCSQGQTHFQFDLFTDNEPNTVSWEVLGSDNAILVEGGDYSDEFKYNSFQECLSVVNECATLRVNDTSIWGMTDEANALSSFYSVMWDGHVVGERFLEKHSPHEILLCDWNKTCSQGETFLGFVVNTDAYPEDFSWKLVSSNGTTLLEEDGYRHKRYDSLKYNYCLTVPIDDCLTFELTDTHHDSGTQYSITWGHLFFQRKQNFVEKESISICNWNVTCPQHHNFFALVINPDAYPGELSWKLLNSNETLEHREYLNNDTVTRDNYTTCLPPLASECVAIEFNDVDGGTSYSITWGDHFVQGVHHVVPTEIVTICL